MEHKHKSKSVLLSHETENQEEEGEFDFQPYIDSVKQKIIPWHLFEKTMIDLSRSNIQRLRYLNAILLTELTTNYSDTKRMKYLNLILMIEFKKRIESDNNISIIEAESRDLSIIELFLFTIPRIFNTKKDTIQYQ